MPPRVRIAFVTDIVTPYMVAVLAALSRVCDLVVIFCSQTGTRGMQWEVELPFEHEVIDGLTIRRRHADATDYYLSPRLASALYRARPDAIISGGFSIPSIYAAGYARLRRIPLLIHSDGTPRSEAALGWTNHLSRQLLHRIAWGAVANSRLAAQRFVEIGFSPGRIFSAPHATNMSPFWNVYNGRQVRAHDRINVLFVGRLIPRKGCEHLLKSCSVARAEGVDVRLTVAGTGPEEPRLRDWSEAQQLPTRWLGFVDQPALPPVYADADVFAFPTLDDPFGIVVLEAAAAGLPIIASPHGGATFEFVRDQINGFVVDPADTRSMTAAIKRLARDPALRLRMGGAAYTATLERGPAVSAAGYLKAVDTAVSFG